MEWNHQAQVSEPKRKDNYRFRSATCCKELKEKLLGSDREGLRRGLGLGIIDRRSEQDRQSEAINFVTC